MQIIQSKSNFVEKVLRDKEGRLVRARFQVFEVAGRIKVRLLDFTYIEALKGAVLRLAGFTKQKIVNVSLAVKQIFISPYFSTDTLSFNGSKPRAPTFL
jgi:hypothetical protein